MEIRYLDFTALIVAIVSVLMVGCVIDSNKNLVVVEEQKPPAPSGPVPIKAPMEVVVEEPVRIDASVVQTPAEQEAPTEVPSASRLSVSDLLAKKPTQEAEEVWLEGVVIDIVSSKPGYAVGTIRESKTFRRYTFATDQQLQRFEKVRFKVDRYDGVTKITMLDVDGNGEADIQVRERGGTSLKRWEEGLRVIEGTTEQIRHARDGKTYGFVRVHDGGFRQYAFVSDLYFANYERVEIKLDQDDVVIEIDRI